LATQCKTLHLHDVMTFSKTDNKYARVGSRAFDDVEFESLEVRRYGLAITRNMITSQRRSLRRGTVRS